MRAEPVQHLKPWQIDLLVASARGRTLGTARCSTISLLWINAWISHFEASLSRLLGRPTRATASRSTTPSDIASSACYHLGISDASRNSVIEIAADEMCCRTLCGPLLKDFAALRGVGGLTASEFGVLDYIVAELLDTLSRGLEEPISVSRSNIGQQAQTQAERMAGSAMLLSLPVTVGVGSARGHLLVSVPHATMLALPPSVRAGIAAASAPADGIRVRLALPSFELPESEASSLGSGDLLLLPMTSLKNAAEGVALAADPGVEVASVDVTADTPTVTSVAIRTLDARVTAVPARQGLVRIQPLVGVAEIRAERLSRLRPGMSLDLPKPEGSVLADFHSVAGVARHRCELVRFEGQLALRLLERRESSSEGNDR